MYVINSFGAIQIRIKKTSVIYFFKQENLFTILFVTK